jgi:PPM family protein phosphatase
MGRRPEETSSDGIGEAFRLSPLIASREFPPLSTRVAVDFAARSVKGRVRPMNEDHYLVMRLERAQETLLTSLPESHVTPRFEEHAYAMIVADGIGGVGGGEHASRVAVASLVQLALHFGKWQVRVDAAVAEDVMQRIEHFYRQVSGALVHESAEGAGPLRTTLTAAVTAGRDLIFAHVGHSRAYLYRDRELIQLTEDHTLGGRRAPARAHLMDLTGAASDLGHILTDTIGAGRLGPRIDIERFTLHDRDIVLLCTNGLTDAVSDERIVSTLSGGSTEQQAENLIAHALAAGTDDDATVVVARYQIPRGPGAYGDRAD